MFDLGPWRDRAQGLDGEETTGVEKGRGGALLGFNMASLTTPGAELRCHRGLRHGTGLSDVAVRATPDFRSDRGATPREGDVLFDRMSSDVSDDGR